MGTSAKRPVHCQICPFSSQISLSRIFLIPGRMSFAKQTEDEVESPGAKSEKSDKSEDDSQLRIAAFHHLFFSSAG